jgi:SAM-dependent methyltransferase
VALNVLNKIALPIVRSPHDDGLIYLARRPDVSWWDRVYAAPQYMGNTLGHQFGFSDRYDPDPDKRQVNAKQRVDEVEDYRSGQKPGQWIDVGPAAGYVLEEARKRGWTVTGVEPNAQAMAALNARGLHAVQGTWKMAPVAAGSADVISFYEVLEHLPDPVAALRKALWVLKPDGLLVIRIPDFSNYTRENTLALLSVSREHLFYFTERSLRLMLDQAGFDLVTTIPSGSQRLAAMLAELPNVPGAADLLYASRTYLARPRGTSRGDMAPADVTQITPSGVEGTVPSRVERPAEATGRVTSRPNMLPVLVHGLLQLTRGAVVAGEPFRTIRFRQIAPAPYKGYAGEMQKGFDQLADVNTSARLFVAARGEDGAALAARINAESGTEPVDVTLLHLQGTEADAPVLAAPRSGKVIMLVHRPEQMVLRQGEAHVKAILAEADAVVLMGEAGAPAYRARLPGKPVASLFHGFFGVGAAVAQERLAADAVAVIGSITAWGELRRMEDVIQLMAAVRQERPDAKVVGYIGGGFDRFANLDQYATRTDVWLLDTAIIRKAQADGAFTDEAGFRNWLYAEAKGRVILRVRREGERLVPEEFAQADGELFTWQERLVDFKTDLFHERILEERQPGSVVPMMEYSGTAHRTAGPAIIVFFDSPSMRDMREREQLEMVGVPVADGRPDFSAAAKTIAELLADPSARAAMVERNLAAARQQPMEVAAFGYNLIARSLLGGSDETGTKPPSGPEKPAPDAGPTPAPADTTPPAEAPTRTGPPGG